MNYIACILCNRECLDTMFIECEFCKKTVCFECAEGSFCNNCIMEFNILEMSNGIYETCNYPDCNDVISDDIKCLQCKLAFCDFHQLLLRKCNFENCDAYICSDHTCYENKCSFHSKHCYRCYNSKLLIRCYDQNCTEFTCKTCVEKSAYHIYCSKHSIIHEVADYQSHPFLQVPETKCTYPNCEEYCCVICFDKTNKIERKLTCPKHTKFCNKCTKNYSLLELKHGKIRSRKVNICPVCYKERVEPVISLKILLQLDNNLTELILSKSFGYVVK